MTEKFSSLSDVIALAEFAHRNQRDKAGLPYIEHPKRVLAKVQAQGARPFVQMAAILHDVTEDTRFTPEMLAELGVPEPAVLLVALLDRDYSLVKWRELAEIYEEHESFPDPDTFYYDKIRENREACMIKLADIEDNLSQWRLEYLPMETQTRLHKKYAKAREMLGWKRPPMEFPNYIIGG